MCYTKEQRPDGRCSGVGCLGLTCACLAALRLSRQGSWLQKTALSAFQKARAICRSLVHLLSGTLCRMRCPKICTVGVYYAVSFEILAALSAISLVSWLLLDLQVFRRLLRNLFRRDRQIALENVTPPPRRGSGGSVLFVCLFQEEVMV